MLEKINKELVKIGMRVRVKNEGVTEYLTLGNANVVNDVYASSWINNRELSDCLLNLKLNTRCRLKLSHLAKAFQIIEEVVNEYESCHYH